MQALRTAIGRAGQAAAGGRGRGGRGPTRGDSTGARHLTLQLDDHLQPLPKRGLAVPHSKRAHFRRKVCREMRLETRRTAKMNVRRGAQKLHDRLRCQVMRFQRSRQGADKALDRDLQLSPGSFPPARCAVQFTATDLSRLRLLQSTEVDLSKPAHSWTQTSPNAFHCHRLQ